MRNSGLLLILLLALCLDASGADRQDSLRGGNGRGRNWWDVQRYELNITFDTLNKSIQGQVNISARITGTPHDSVQIDLQDFMTIGSAVVNGRNVAFAREGNVWWLQLRPETLGNGELLHISIGYNGKPRIAKHAPWDGGFIWTRDSSGKLWAAVACQGLGASAWWPCKDYQGDEPDSGMTVHFSGTGMLSVVGNGQEYTYVPAEASGFTWGVRNPINTYNTTFYIGDYVSWKDTLMGEKGKLDLSFHVLRYNEERARKHFAVTKQMLHCFEYWMGPYPFYEDGYKLVEAPFLGMEHQSAVAYGNKYRMGYLGSDRSGTGVGLLFDFIIVHESGHEWFGNNITAKDIADNWIHEGFTTYTEALFAECAFGREKAFEYTRGEWKAIENDRPVIGNYGVNDDGSGDKYDKGSAVVHMIRTIMNDDEKFRQLLRGLNRDFYHQTVTSRQVEEYISRFAGYDFAPLFDQYLRTTNVPKLEWYIKNRKLHYRFVDAVPGFTLPLPISAEGKKKIIIPTTDWQSTPWKKGFDIEFSKDFLIKTQ